MYTSNPATTMLERSNGRIAALATSLALALSFSPAEAIAVTFGTATWHNGTVGSTPPGSGDVDVVFSYGSAARGPHNALHHEMATHQVEFTYAPGPATCMTNYSFIYNRTDVAWTGFRIFLAGADFAGWDYDNPVQAPAENPVVFVDHTTPLPRPADEISLYRTGGEWSLANSTITRFNDQGSGFTDAELIVHFEDPVQFRGAFALLYNVIPSPGAAGAPGFTMYLTPIPEPATALLLGLGAVGVLRRRRG